MKEQIIPVAEIWASNVPNTKRITLKVLKAGEGYYYLTHDKHKSTFYRTLVQAKTDIQDAWGKWINFKLLI